MNEICQQIGVNALTVPIDMLVKWYFNRTLMVDREYERRLVQERVCPGVMQQRKQSGYFNDGIVLVLSKDAAGTESFVIRSGLEKIQYVIRYVLNEAFANNYDEFMQFWKKDRSSRPSDRQIIIDSICIALLHDFNDELDKVLCSVYQKPVHCGGVEVENSEVQKMICRIASAVRGDNTTNRIVPLYDIEEQTIVPMISESDTGIPFQETFWGKFSLMSFENLQNSMDESVICSLYRQIMSNPLIQVGDSYPLGEMENRFIRVFDTFEAIFRNGAEVFMFLPTEKNLRLFKNVTLTLYFFDVKGGEITDYDGVCKYLQMIMPSFELLHSNEDDELRVVPLMVCDLLVDKFGVAQ